MIIVDLFEECYVLHDTKDWDDMYRRRID